MEKFNGTKGNWEALHDATVVCDGKLVAICFDSELPSKAEEANANCFYLFHIL